MAIARGDPIVAADMLGRLMNRPAEAYTRLRAAESLVREGRRSEADAQLSRALAFYREVGATAYIREAEALLAIPA